MPPTSLSTPTRLELLATTAAAGAMSMLAGTRSAEANCDGVSPFSVNFPEDQLDDLRRRVAATRWPDRETVADDTQ
ncbi:epoxide hydrolase N-terminal domain-containing protein, partial [Rhizobium ruizarguesonis]